MSEGGLDALLDLFDADPDWDSSDDDDPFKDLDNKVKSQTASASLNTSANSSQGNELTFEQLFGAPINKKSSASASTSGAGSGGSIPKSKSLPRSSYSSISNPKPLPSVPYNGVPVPTQRPQNYQPQSVVIVDPFSKTRLVKSSALHLTIGDDGKCNPLESSLQERNPGIQHVGLSTLPRWFRAGGNKDKVQFWTSGVLARKPPGLRKSSKGNDYALWEVVDLNNVEQAWTVFIFGSAAGASALLTFGVGTLVDLLNPSILQDSAGDRIKLSINNTNQIRRVGEAKDFGYCESKKKDGNPCTAIVNKIDCPVCIHHASAELKKANRKKKKTDWSVKAKTGKMGIDPLGRVGGDGNGRVSTIDFGSYAPKPVTKLPNSVPTAAAAIGKKQLVRMELQDPSNVLKRNPAALGNHTSISFKKEFNPLQLPANLQRAPEKKAIVLDPLKTRHLTDRDRKILEALSGSPRTTNTELPNMLSSPNAGARNFLKYLNRSDGKNAKEVKEICTARIAEPEVGTKLTMNREALLSMQKALSYVKQNGPIAKKNPNVKEAQAGRTSTGGTKRKLSDEGLGLSEKRTNDNTSSAEKKKSAQTEEFEKVVAAKSKHAGLAEELQETDYFEKLERKESVENKLLTTFKIPTTAVMCKECKYVALSRSDLCKDLGHEIRLIKAVKRFFKCKFCGNRAMSLDRLPKRPCTICKSSSWLVAPVGREKAGPALASESLSIRGDEETFLGSSSGKLFLNLD